MPTDHIVSLLIAERDRINKAIEALGGGGAAKRGPAPAVTPVAAAGPKRRNPRSAAQRKAQSERMRAFWAARRKAQAPKAAPPAKASAKSK